MEETGYRRAFSAGAVLGKSVGIWFANLVPFTLLACVVYSPLIAYTYIVASGPMTPADVQRWELIDTFGGQLLGLIVTGALIYGVLQQLRGKPAGLLESLGVGLRRLLPCLAVGILVGLIVVIVGGFAAFVIIVGTQAASAGGTLVSLIAVVPVIWMLCVCFVAVPVAVIERPGIADSLNRSAELTKGCRLSIFGIMLVIFAIGVVIGLAAGVSMDVESTSFLWFSLAVTVFVGTFQAVNSAVVYHDLRVSKEGVGIEDLVSVFA